jgi:hypothetical protein
MRQPKYLQNVLIGATAVLIAGTIAVPSHNQPGPVLTAAVAFATGKTATPASAASGSAGYVATATQNALTAFTPSVGALSRPQALEDAFRSYFAYKTEHPSDVKKPYLYFVDYGQASTARRGYVFDMESLTLVDGPFTVAHGRGSSTTRYGVPTTFSNASNYVTRAIYDFHGHAGGQAYSSVGLRLDGVSTGFNDNALARKVVAHGAPYVTPDKAGRSEGCPAMEPDRAAKLLPKLAGGAMVYLFAPDENWMANDPWLTAAGVM